MLYRISVTERGLTGIANIFRSRLSRLDDLLGAGTVPLRNWDLSFWTPVNFEVEYFINEETEGVLTDTVIYFSDQHLTWLSQLKPNAKVG